MKKKSRTKLLIILPVLLILAIQAYLFSAFGNFTGTDDLSVDVIHDIAPNYTPWFSSLWEPQGDKSEMILFGFQAALGLSVLCFYVLKQRSKLNSSPCE